MIKNKNKKKKNTIINRMIQINYYYYCYYYTRYSDTKNEMKLKNDEITNLFITRTDRIREFVYHFLLQN